jgi:hypothetical protein
MELIKHIFNFWRALVRSHEIKSSRNFTDFLTDRLIQVSTEGSLLAATEKLGKLLQSNFQYISSKIITNFLTNATKENSEHILTWVRQPAIFCKCLFTLAMLLEESYVTC